MVAKPEHAMMPPHDSKLRTMFDLQYEGSDEDAAEYRVSENATEYVALAVDLPRVYLVE